MITLPTAYSNSLARPHKENWLFRLYNSSGSFVGIALDDCTDDAGDHYYGVITSSPSISESINLADSTASVSNISVELANFKYVSSKFSAELLFGSTNYINQQVKIYSRVNDGLGSYFGNITETFDAYDVEFSTASDDKLLIYTGRLASVSHDHNTISLEIIATRPWDDLTIPNSYTTTNRVPVPVAYGSFTKNTNSTYTSPQYLTSLTETDYRPVPLNINEGGSGRFGYVTGLEAISSDAEPAFYDEQIKQFLPITSGTSTTTNTDGAHHTRASIALTRGFKIRPRAYELISGTGLDDSSYAYDTSTSTYAFISTGATATHEWRFHFGSISGEWNRSITDIDWELVVTKTTPLVGSATLSYKFDSDASYTSITTVSAPGTTNGTKNVSDKPSRNDDHITIKLDVTGVTGDWNVECRIKDIDATWEGTEKDDRHNVAYIAADGLSKSYSSGTATKIHEAHRDLLHRFTSLDLTTDPTGWSALDTDRSAWTLRWWLLEPTELKEILDQLAYEGGFIYRMRQDETLQYIHIANTPSFNHTVTKDDLNNLQISHTSFSDLITKINYEYDKHPAEDRYLSTATHTNSTTRTYYNINSEENVKEIELDALTAAIAGGTGANASHGNYYDGIYSKVMIHVDCDIINPQIASAVEVGDMVKFSSMPIDPFNASFASNYYIVTQTDKSPGKMSIHAIEVADTSGGGGGE